MLELLEAAQPDELLADPDLAWQAFACAMLAEQPADE